MLENDLFDFLTSDSQVFGKVGSRIYPIRLPEQFDVPACTYLLTQTDSLTRGHGESWSLQRPNIQIDSWGHTFKEAVEVDAVILKALDGYKGSWTTVGIESSVAGTTPYDFPDEETGLFRRVREYRILWKELNP